MSWLTGALMILICADVLMRYCFSTTKTWVLELEWHLFSIIFLVGASYTLLHDKHVRVDVFYEHFSHNIKKMGQYFGHVIVYDSVGPCSLLLRF